MNPVEFQPFQAIFRAGLPDIDLKILRGAASIQPKKLF
jgi:hypothetical protein